MLQESGFQHISNVAVADPKISPLINEVDIQPMIHCTTLSILMEINPEYSLEGPMLKLKLQCFSHLLRRTDSLKKTLMLGKTEGRRRRGRQRMRWLDGITDSMDTSLSELTFLDPSWGYQGKNTEVVCYSLLQWTTFCSELSIKTLLS